MRKIFIILFVGAISAGCSIISSTYVPSLEIQRQKILPSEVQVYYENQEIPFSYKEIGRIFLKNINYWADRDPAGQITKIKAKAAESGADAVIIIKEMRRESSFIFSDGAAGGSAGDIFQYSGIAIIKD